MICVSIKTANIFDVEIINFLSYTRTPPSKKSCVPYTGTIFSVLYYNQLGKMLKGKTLDTYRQIVKHCICLLLIRQGNTHMTLHWLMQELSLMLNLNVILRLLTNAITENIDSNCARCFQKLLA